MSESKFKTLRHIETVRNYLNLCVKEILNRQERHDQSKLEELEVETFEKFTPKLRDCTYGTPIYQGYLEEMQVALKNHYNENPHHPEHFKDGIKEMNLIDIIEMLVDWKAASMRHNDGDILKSIELNQKRFGYSDELKQILINTAVWLNDSYVFNKVEES